MGLAPKPVVDLKDWSEGTLEVIVSLSLSARLVHVMGMAVHEPSSRVVKISYNHMSFIQPHVSCLFGQTWPHIALSRSSITTIRTEWQGIIMRGHGWYVIICDLVTWILCDSLAARNMKRPRSTFRKHSYWNIYVPILRTFTFP